MCIMVICINTTILIILYSHWIKYNIQNIIFKSEVIFHVLSLTKSSYIEIILKV